MVRRDLRSASSSFENGVSALFCMLCDMLPILAAVLAPAAVGTLISAIVAIVAISATREFGVEIGALREVCLTTGFTTSAFGSSSSRS